MDYVAETAAMTAVTQVRYKLLSDPNATVIKAYGVYDLLGDGVAAPAVFIIGPNMKLEWSYVGKDVGDRPSAADILVHLEQRLTNTNTEVTSATWVKLLPEGTPDPSTRARKRLHFRL